MYLSCAFDFTRVSVHSLQLIDSGHYLYTSTTISTLLTQVPSRTSANENGKDPENALNSLNLSHILLQG